jgi:hypothetical protein
MAGVPSMRAPLARATVFHFTPWLSAYWPVSSVARDGQQSEKLMKLRSKVVPRSPISRRVLRIAHIECQS